MTKREIIKHFCDRGLDKEAEEYLNIHAERYSRLIDAIKGLKKSDGNVLEILDIGPSFLTELLSNEFPGDDISTLGLEANGESRGGHFPKAIDIGAIKKNFVLDLNTVSLDKDTSGNNKFDIIILAEVIEHLYASPKTVIGFLKKILQESGVIIIQTPNALSIDKKVAILRGIHPYEMVRESKINPGHFREYAFYELAKILEQLDMEIIGLEFFNYPPPKPQGIKGRFLDLFYRIVKKIKPKLRDSMTLVAKK